MIKIAPSIASGPLTNLSATIKELEEAGVSVIHFDVEDGSFVPEMNLGIKVIEELRPLTHLPFDVHLMMNNPEWLIPILADMGVNMLSVHYEACPYPRRTLQLITKHNMQAGLAFNPATPIPDLAYCLPYLSFILILSTEPEVDHPAHLPSILDKVKVGKNSMELDNVLWVVDGGISAENAGAAVKAGADMLIVGRGIYNEGKIKENMREILAAIDIS
jgi:ribulose-phosphate 3-epimerase